LKKIAIGRKEKNKEHKITTCCYLTVHNVVSSVVVSVALQSSSRRAPSPPISPDYPEKEKWYYTYHTMGENNLPQVE
jgi:hypothetical protein